MIFHKQSGSNDCQIVAIKTLLSHFDIDHKDRYIKAQLPKHPYGNNPKEIADFLTRQGLIVKLIRNETGSEIVMSELNELPFIANVNWHKIKAETYGKQPHYIVGLKQNDSEKILLYDGSNFGKVVEYDFNQLLQASRQIDRYNHNGSWIIVQSYEAGLSAAGVA